MRDIIEATGLSKGGFYHHFDSKEQLFQEVLFYFLQSMDHHYERYSRESFQRFYQDYLDETVELTQKYAAKFSGAYSEQLITMNYFSLMFDALRLFPEFQEKAIIGFDEELEHWIAAVEIARSKGEIRSQMTDRQIGELFLYLSDGLGLHLIMRGMEAEELSRHIQQRWDQLYNLIKA